MNILKHFLTVTLLLNLSLFAFTKNDKKSSDPSDMPVGHYFTIEDFKTWDITSDLNAPFNKSFIPLRNRLVYHKYLANSNARINEAGVSPLVLFSGGEVPSQGSSKFDRVYAFNNWQYADIMGYWGGGPGVAGYVIMLPTGSAIDAAHKNGVELFGNIFFAPVVYGGEIERVRSFLEKDGSSYPVADKMIEAANYFGFDGWFINQETAGADAALAEEMIQFIKYIQDNSDIKIYWYDAMTESGPVNWQNELNNNNDKFFQDGSTLVSDYMFLNFWWDNTSNLSDSREKAIQLGRDPYTVYAGIDCAIKGYETSVDWDAIFPSGSSHNTSIGLYRPDDFLWYQTSDIQEKLRREKRFWSGANGDPSNTETSHNWKGFANYIPSNSVIDDIPFSTNFSLGFGQYYFLEGEKVLDESASENGWNNIAMQDILPSWRWLIKSSGEKLNASFDFDNAFTGGNSIKFSGNLTSDNSVNLFKTALDLSSNTKIKIDYKPYSSGYSYTGLYISFEENPNSFVEIPLGDSETSEWQSKILDLGSYSGKTIAVIGLKFNNAGLNDFNFNLGGISIYENTPEIPEKPTNIEVINKQLESDYMTLRLKWKESTKPIKYYKVFKKNSDASLTFLAGATGNYCFVPKLKKSSTDTSLTIIVEAISEDGSRSEQTEFNLEWYSAPDKAENPNPESGQTNVYRNTKLIWSPGSGAEKHSVYFGSGDDLELIGSTKSNEISPGLLEANTTYHWRVDEENLLFSTKGEEWTFTTGSGIIDTSNNALMFDGVDDFINCGNNPSLQITGNKITLEAWINPSNFKNEVWQGVVIGKDQSGAGADYGYMLRCGKDGRVNFNVGNGSWNELNSNGNEIKINTWHHIAGVMDGGYMRIYIDGEEIVKKRLYSISIKNASSANLLIGDSPAFPGRVFDGKIDEVRIWNKGRTQEQIKATMNQGLTENYFIADSGLVAYYKFDEAEGQTVYDLSSFGNNAILGASNGTDSKDPDWTNSSSIVSVESIETDEIPEVFALKQNYPNPFNPETTIEFTISDEGNYKLKIINILGQIVDEPINEYFSSGSYKVNFNGNLYSSGIYFYNLSGQNHSQTKKMILIK